MTSAATQTASTPVRTAIRQIADAMMDDIGALDAPISAEDLPRSISEDHNLLIDLITSGLISYEPDGDDRSMVEFTTKGLTEATRLYTTSPETERIIESIPSELLNDNCVQDAAARLREAEELNEPGLIRRRQEQLQKWIDEASKDYEPTKAEPAEPMAHESDLIRRELLKLNLRFTFVESVTESDGLVALMEWRSAKHRYDTERGWVTSKLEQLPPVTPHEPTDETTVSLYALNARSCEAKNLTRFATDLLVATIELEQASAKLSKLEAND